MVKQILIANWTVSYQSFVNVAFYEKWKLQGNLNFHGSDGGKWGCHCKSNTAEWMYTWN